MKVVLENVSVSFPNWSMQNCSLEISSGSFTSIVGPSGSGKTTLLRIIAGLQKIDSGKVIFDGKDVTQLEPESRDTGFVFQGDSLFHHLNVFDNVAFGPRMKRGKNISVKVMDALAIVGLGDFEKRSVTNLSGGEKKRVSIARAIAFGPGILLLDEPLNGLDARLKEKTKVFLKGLQAKTGLTVLMVTHDVDEAFYLSDKIVVMSNGKIEQIGLPHEIFLKPKNAFLKDFVSDYILVEANEKTISGKKVLEAKFTLEPKKGVGKAFINLKKTNYRFVE